MNITNERLAALIAQQYHDPDADVHADLYRALTELQQRREAEAGTQCCMCGKTGLSTIEGDGGQECELDDGRWVCSGECWDRAVAASPSSPASGVRVKLHRFRPIGADRWSEWRFGPANLTPASGCEWEDVDFVPALSALGEHP